MKWLGQISWKHRSVVNVSLNLRSFPINMFFVRGWGFLLQKFLGHWEEFRVRITWQTEGPVQPGPRCSNQHSIFNSLDNGHLGVVLDVLLSLTSLLYTLDYLLPWHAFTVLHINCIVDEIQQFIFMFCRRFLLARLRHDGKWPLDVQITLHVGMSTCGVGRQRYGA